MKDSLGDRMKRNEAPAQGVLQPRTPVIIRVDGKAFHTYTKGFARPFSGELHSVMCSTMKALCENIQNAVFGYTQSDEISILLNDWKKFNTSQWFDGKIQKIVSVSASIATAHFNKRTYNSNLALFDARVFNLPKEEVVNYYHWRQKDWNRNSVHMLARSYYSHKELHGLNSGQVQDKLFTDLGVNWAELDGWKKDGSVCARRDDEERDNWFVNPAFRFNEHPHLIRDLLSGEE